MTGLEKGADSCVAKSVPPEGLLAHVKVGVRLVKRQRALVQKIEELTNRRLKPEA